MGDVLDKYRIQYGPCLRSQVSHSSIDDALATALARLFPRASRLPAENIRCSSADGYQLGGGDLTDETLRREVFEADTFVGLITPASIRSRYVLFELGARWGVAAGLRPLLAGRVVAGAAGALLANMMCLNAGNKSQMMQLISQLASELVVQCEASHALMPDLQVVENLARAKDLDSLSFAPFAGSGPTKMRIPSAVTYNSSGISSFRR